MTDNDKIHKILEYINKNYTHGIIDTDEISRELNLNLSEVNNLARKIIQYGDAKDGGSDDTSTLEKNAISILQTVATKDAYETKKYLNPDKDRSGSVNIETQNLHMGDNYGSYSEANAELSPSKFSIKSALFKILIGVVVIVIGWFITQYLLIPFFS